MGKLIKLAGISQQVDIDQPIYAGSNFTWAEATAQGTRIPQTTTFNGVVIPAAQITANIVKIAEKLDKIRADFGHRPIVVTSWYRPRIVNRAVGGVRDSQHLLGWGVDIQIHGLLAPNVADKLAKTWAGGLGDNPKYTHLDLRHLMGYSSARWDYGNA